MIIDIIDEHQYLTDAQLQLIHGIIQTAASQIGLPSTFEVDISLVDNETIQTLNRTYRQIDRPTDVLSFALEEVSSEFDVDFAQMDLLSEVEAIEETIELDEWDTTEEEATSFIFEKHLGDIIISYPKCVEQAEAYAHSIDRELAFLAVHGFLHLNGYDHQTPDQEKAMFALQEEVLQVYGLER